MKKFISAAIAGVMTLASMAAYVPQVGYAENPIVQTSFTPDPAPVVFGDELYVFTGRDRDGNNDFYYMTGWQCFSTKDMKNWTDHGCFLEDAEFSWCNKNDAWASQCIERNGKYYFYFTTTNKGGGGRAIGVGVADKPEGPYKDVLGKPLCGPNWDYIDPTVIVDDDGQAWLMFGNPKCYYVKLKEDMVTLDGQIQNFNLSLKPGTKYTEGPWIYKHDKLYYLVFASMVDGFGGESISYCTGPTVTGPWTHQGTIHEGSNCFTTHGGIIDYKGHSYSFYHMNGIPGGGSFNRSAACEEFTYNADGTIPVIKSTKNGPNQIEALNPFERVEAETICWCEGVKTEKCSDGGINIGNIKDGSYIKVSGVDFGDGADKFIASVSANGSGGTVELHTESKTGPVIGKLDVSGTGGWQNWEEVSTNVKVSGKHDLYLVFRGGSDSLLNMDWWKFEGSGGSSTTTTTSTTSSVVTTTSKNNTTAPVVTTTKASSGKGEILAEYGFENGDDSWEGRGGASIKSVGTESFGGENSLYVVDRSDAWNGASVALGSSFKAGETYSFSSNIKYTSGKDMQTFYFTLQYKDSSDEVKYAKIAKANALKGDWVQLANSSFTLPKDATDMVIYLETASGTNDFYVDDVKIADAGTIIKGAKGKTFNLADINCDGKVNGFDLALARKGLTKGFDEELGGKAADVDRSGKFELNDFVLICEYLMGKKTEFPDNSPEPEKSDFDYNANLQYKAAPDSYFRQPAQHGTVVKENYNSINGNKNMYVYLPYGYDESKKYNVFYLMHGGGESEETCFNDDNINIDIMLDNMIANGDIEPMIVVTPTFNKAPSADGVWEEMRKSIIPYVEDKYSTYAEDTSIEGLRASRFHRAYGGFSMGGGSTWANFNNNLDIIAYFMPLSGHCWDGANKVIGAAKNSGFKQNEYFVLAATGTKDLAYDNMVPMINELKKHTDVFTYTSDFSQGNLYFLEAPGNVHWWPQVRHYIYDALPYFFHEGQ